MKSLLGRFSNETSSVKRGNLIEEGGRWVLQVWELFEERIVFGILRLVNPLRGPSLPRLQPANIFCCIHTYQVKPVAALPVTSFTLKQQPGC